MKVQLPRKTLAESLAKIVAIADGRNNREILNNFSMSAGNGIITLAATDYENDIIVQTDANIYSSGKFCVNAKRLHDAVKNMNGEMIEMFADKSHAKFKSGTSEITLPTIEVGLYPVVEREETLENILFLPTRTFFRSVEQTLFAASINESRRNLMGICLVVKQGRVELIATDGHRLAKVCPEIDEPLLDTEAIIPRKSLLELLKSEELFGNFIEIQFDERVMQFVGGQIIIKTRLIEGKFPNCDPIIPKDNSLLLEVNREHLVNSLRIVSSISNEKLRPVKLTIENSKLRLESEKAEHGQVRDELDVSYSGDALQIGFNCRYLLDALSVMTSENIQMEFKSAMSPSLIRQAGDASFLSVLMPLRIEW